MNKPEELSESDRNYIEHLAQQIEHDHDTVYHGAKHAAETTIWRERDRYARQSSPVSVDINRPVFEPSKDLVDVVFNLMQETYHGGDPLDNEVGKAVAIVKYFEALYKASPPKQTP
jgi:hypothetical protein